MKNTIIRFGLISGGISAILLALITLITNAIGHEKVNFGHSFYIGYGAIAIAMSVVFFGIRSYRDMHNSGGISIVQGLLTGLGIVLISCVIYSLAWLVVYYFFLPNFVEDYSNYALAQAKGNETALAETNAQLNMMKDWYKNPFSIFAITLIEPLPVGLLFTFVSALILRKK